MIERIGSSQRDDPNILEIISKLEMNIDGEEMNLYGLDRDGWLRKNGRLVVPNVNGLRDEVLRECHHSKLTIHPGGNKMYRDMRQTYYWEGMKRDVGKFISKCMNCQLVKAEQRSLVGCCNH